MPDESELTYLEAFLREICSVALKLNEPKDDSDLSSGVRGLLQVLGKNGSKTVPQIARLRGTSRQNVQIVVNRLLESGHVEFHSNPAHKRSKMVRLTSSGQALLERTAQHDNWFLKQLAARISEREIASATDVLRKVKTLASNGQEEQRPAQKIKEESYSGTIAKQRPTSPAVPEKPKDEPEPEPEEFPINLL